MFDKEKDERLEEKTKKQSKVEQIVVCLVCVFLLACVACSLYVITERITTMKRSLEDLDTNQHVGSTLPGKSRSFRHRRSLKSKFDVCSLQHTDAIDSILNSKELKLQFDTLCAKSSTNTVSRHSTPPSVTPAKTRDKVFFPLDSNDGLKLLLRREIMKELLGKVKRNRNSTWGKEGDSLEDDDDDSYAPHADLYFGGQLFTKDGKSSKSSSSSGHHTSAPVKKPTTHNVVDTSKTKSKEKVKFLAPMNTHISPPPSSQKKVHSKDGDYEIPVFPEDYHSSGLIILPHSGIAEPFEVWFAPSKQKSRIDYYYGTWI